MINSYPVTLLFAVVTNVSILLTMSIQNQEKKVRRINEMITKRKMHRSVIKFSQLILVEGMEISVENLYVGMRLKGLMQVRVGLPQA